MELRTDRLRLREFVSDDWKAVHQYQSDLRYQVYYEQLEWSETSVRQFVEKFVDQQASKPRTRFQLAVEVDGQLIGNCGLRLDERSTRQGNIGFELSPDEWGKGYATEAAARTLKFGFEDLGLNRIWAECIGDNRASAHVLEKIGMQRELCQREHLHFKGRFWDRVVYGITLSDWAGMKGEVR